MILVRQLLTPQASKERLATKPSAEHIFGSTDSGAGIYRSTDDIGGNSKTSSVDSVFSIGKDDTCCVYNVDVESPATRKILEARDIEQNNDRRYVEVG